MPKKPEQESEYEISDASASSDDSGEEIVINPNNKAQRRKSMAAHKII